MGPRRFRIRWIEEHEVIIVADDEDDAMEKSYHMQGTTETCQTVNSDYYEDLGAADDC